MRRTFAKRAVACLVLGLVSCVALVLNAAIAAGQEHKQSNDDGERRSERQAERRRDRNDDWRAARDGPYGPGWPGRGDRDLRSPNDEEWAEVIEFMSRYSPWRQAAVERVSDARQREWLKKHWFARYRGMQALQRRDKEEYAGRLQQLKVEDDIYRLVSEWGGAGEEEKGRIRTELREHVSKLVELDLQERQRRVERQEAQLKAQKDKLEEDLKGREELIEKRVGHFLDWGSRWPSKHGQGGDKGRDGDKRDKKGETEN